jgi:hypothetical protein
MSDEAPVMDRQERMAETKAATEASIAQVEEHAFEEWKLLAYECLVECAKKHPEFTSDEVWLALEEHDTSTHEPAAMGPIFLRGARAGIIVNTKRHRKRSVYSKRHHELTLWASLICPEAKSPEARSAELAARARKAAGWIEAEGSPSVSNRARLAELLEELAVEVLA